MNVENTANDHTTSGAASLATIAPATAGMLIAAMHSEGGGAFDVPKPFSQSICLVPDTRVAGATHVERIEELAQGLSEGDRLRLERDPHNRQDKWAIRVLNLHGNRLGFVPVDVNEIPARLMDGGKRLYGKVTEVRLVGNWWRIAMGVWMDD